MTTNVSETDKFSFIAEECTKTNRYLYLLLKEYMLITDINNSYNYYPK